MPMLNDEELETLEKMIDRTGVSGVLAGLATICAAKSDHIAENWQDQPLARKWSKLATRLDKMAASNPGNLDF